MIDVIFIPAWCVGELNAYTSALKVIGLYIGVHKFKYIYKEAYISLRWSI